MVQVQIPFKWIQNGWREQVDPWMNIEDEHGNQVGVKYSTIDWLYGNHAAAPETILNYITAEVDQEIPEDHEGIGKIISEEKCNNSYVTFIPRKYWNMPFVREAKEKEIRNFQKYMVYTEVEWDSQPFVTSDWVVTEKVIDGEKGCKARLVVHGNQAMDQLNTDSPTVRKCSLRLLFFLAAQFGWKVKTADVTSAFLQADQLDRDVYVKPPADIHVAGTLWKLRVPVYGLGDSGKKWYLTIANWLVEKG